MSAKSTLDPLALAPLLRIIVGGPERPGIVAHDASDAAIEAAREQVPADDALIECHLTGTSHADAIGPLRSQITKGVNAVVVPGCGVFATGADAAVAKRRLHGITSGGDRTTLSVRPPQQRRLAGRVAVVTGAAQGLGFDLARALLEAGAHVALADVNEGKLQSACEPLHDRFGPERAVAIVTDVAQEPSVAACFATVARIFGGFDLVVSNAGVLRTGSVKSQSLADFDLVTNVNFRGYFLVVKHAAPVLASQRRAHPAYVSDIVQISSKSGLLGSNRNGAYSGAKFGGIGLTQSFALELVDDGIKVNAICPGNLFDGPLWSDPETGLFVQYLREDKVPGAETIADVRQAYEAKIPMRRGCTSEDVARALFYVIEQRYETGQAIPVTGGQVMLP